VTTEIPHEVQIALPRGTKTPQVDYPPIRVFRFSGDALTIGVESVLLDDVSVQIYNLPKTVVDCFRFRNKLGIDVSVSALNEAVHRKGVTPAELMKVARKCLMENVMRPYLEAIQ
jgi:predicted transcriptional regulator of viral defense system